MVSSLGLRNQSLVAIQNRFQGLFDLPLSDVTERLRSDSGLLCRFGHSPTFSPVIGELFKEWSLDVRGLEDE